MDGARSAAALLSVALILGCSGDLPTVPTTAHLGQLTFHGGVDVAESFPVQLGFILEVRNTSDRDLELLSDGCGLLPRAFRTEDRDQRPVWDTRRNGAREPCRASVTPLTIPAGQSRRLARGYGAADVLGDSLPDGRYHFSVTYRASLVDSEEVRLIEVTGGEARLELPRRPVRARSAETLVAVSPRRPGENHHGSRRSLPDWLGTPRPATIRQAS